MGLSLPLSIMPTEDNNKMLRTTKEQIECYLNYIRVHPEMKLHKNDPTRPKRVEELWVELTSRLNALKGPTRTPTKWRQNLCHWKNQVRSRARKANAHRLVTGGDSTSTTELSETKKRALGSITADGMADLPTIGTEEEVIINATSTPSPLMTNTDVSNDSTLSSFRPKINTTDEMFRSLMAMTKENCEEEKVFRAQILETIRKYADSMNNLATALLSLSQSIAKGK